MTQEEVTKEVENYNGTNSFMNSLKKGLKKKYLLGMVPNCIGITVVCCMRHNT